MLALVLAKNKSKQLNSTHLVDLCIKDVTQTSREPLPPPMTPKETVMFGSPQ